MKIVKEENKAKEKMNNNTTGRKVRHINKK